MIYITSNAHSASHCFPSIENEWEEVSLHGIAPSAFFACTAAQSSASADVCSVVKSNVCQTMRNSKIRHSYQNVCSVQTDWPTNYLEPSMER